MANTIDLKRLNKAAVLAALYNASRPQGLGFMKYNATPMSVEEARTLLKRTTSFDYLNGRVMKISLDGDELDPWLYDLDNGQGAAEQAINALRGTSDPNNVVIRAQHASGVEVAAQDVLEHLEDEPKLSTQGGTVVFELGLSDVAHRLKPRVENARRSNKSPLE